jgi:hypothetical protein
VVRPYGDLGLVEIASGAEGFALKAQALFRRDPEWLKRVDAQLALNSWDMTWKSMQSLVQRAKGKAARPVVAEAAE